MAPNPHTPQLLSSCRSPAAPAAFNFTAVNDALTALGLEPISGNLNETDKL